MASLAHASAEFVQALRRGLEAYDIGDHERAYDEFSQALDIEPDNVWGLLWKGATAPSAADAAMWLEQALALDPDNEHAAAGLAWAQSQMEAAPVSAAPVLPTPEVEEAEVEEAEERAAQEEESDLTWLRQEAVQADETLVPTELAGEAAESFHEEAFDVAPERDEDEDLPDWLREVQDTGQNDVPAWLRSGEPPAPVKVDADLPDWLSGDAALAEEEKEQVEEEAEAPAAGPLPDWLAEEETLIDTGRRAEGSLPPSDAAVEAYQVGLLAYEENRLDEALQAFERTIKLDPGHVEAHNYLGSVYFLQGRTEEAINTFNQALEFDPDHAESYLNLGLVYQEINQPARAVQMFERYLELEPDSSIAGEVEGFIRDLRG